MRTDLILPKQDSSSQTELSHDPDVAGRILIVPVLLLLAAIIRKAWLDLDTSWDAIEYHLPFAALRVGLTTLVDYHPSNLIMERYYGFPVLPDFIQGGLWLLTNRIQAANFIGLIGVVSLALVLKRLYQVPAVYLLLGLFSVPVILIQSTSSYLDLFVNSWMAVMLMLILSAFLYPGSFTTTRLVGVFASLAIVLNSKFQMLPVAGLALAFLVVLLLVRHAWFDGLSLLDRRTSKPCRLGVVGLLCGLLVLAFANEIKNWVEFDDPIYPIPMAKGKVIVPSEINNKPDYLAHTPQFFRWVISTVEYKSFEGRNPLWTNGQGDVPLTSPALFMGGDFGALVLLNFLWFCFLQLKVKSQFGWRPSWFIGLLTVVTAMLPGSPQTRYYLYWIICLIATNLVLIVDGLAAPQKRDAKFLYLGGMASLLIFVLCATDFAYITRNGEKPRVFVEEVGAKKRLIAGHLRPGETVCVVTDGPYAFMYSPMFNPDLEAQYHYHIREARSPGECATLRILP